MPYAAKNFEHLIGVDGFSDVLLKNHFALYQGYVANTNKLDETLVGLEKDNKFNIPEYAELNRRLGWEFNGMRLHEYYFENLTKEPKELNNDSQLFQKIIQEFNSYDFWVKDFKSLSAIRGIGWVVLYYDFLADRLFNVWIDEHDKGHFAGAAPLLVIDVFEHAYLLDYGLKRVDYIDKFFKNINWQAVELRLHNNRKDPLHNNLFYCNF